VGTLVDMGSGRRRPGEMMGILAACDRAAAGRVAPPEGLVLWEVRY
jgi:tRNA pseudouridine38-40 synthase